MINKLFMSVVKKPADKSYRGSTADLPWVLLPWVCCNRYCIPKNLVHLSSMTEDFLSPSLELEPVEETDKLLTEVKLVGETVGITKG